MTNHIANLRRIARIRSHTEFIGTSRSAFDHSGHRSTLECRGPARRHLFHSQNSIRILIKSNGRHLNNQIGDALENSPKNKNDTFQPKRSLVEVSLHCSKNHHAIHSNPLYGGDVCSGKHLGIVQPGHDSSRVSIELHQQLISCRYHGNDGRRKTRMVRRGH